MATMLTILGTVVTVMSFIYAVYANRKHSKLVNYNRDQAWEFYRQSSKVLGLFQELEGITSDNKDIVTKVAKGEAAAQELILNSIRAVKRFESKYDSGTIEKWAKDGKLANESQIRAFKGYLE